MMTVNEGFYDFKKPEDVSRYVKEFNDTRDELVKKQNEINDLKYDNMQLKTENNDMTAAVSKTLKILYEEYHYGTLPMEHYDKIYNSLKDADL